MFVCPVHNKIYSNKSANHAICVKFAHESMNNNKLGNNKKNFKFSSNKSRSLINNDSLPKYIPFKQNILNNLNKLPDLKTCVSQIPPVMKYLPYSVMNDFVNNLCRQMDKVVFAKTVDDVRNQLKLLVIYAKEILLNNSLLWEANNKVKIKIIKQRIENWKKGNYFILWEQVMNCINKSENKRKFNNDDKEKKTVNEKENEISRHNKYLNKKLTFFAQCNNFSKEMKIVQSKGLIKVDDQNVHLVKKKFTLL